MMHAIKREEGRAQTHSDALRRPQTMSLASNQVLTERATGTRAP